MSKINNILRKIDKLDRELIKVIDIIKFYKKEIYRNKDKYGILKTDCKSLIKYIDKMFNIKIKLNDLYYKQNQISKTETINIIIK